MKQSFSHKLTKIIPYCEQFQTVTFFELSRYLGAFCFLLLIVLFSLPLFFTANQWITLPVSAFCIMCATWYFFDTSLWLPDSLKAKSIPSLKLKKYASIFLSIIHTWETRTNNWLPSSKALFNRSFTFIQATSTLLICTAAFVIGFVQCTSYLPIFSLVLLTLGLLFEDIWMTLAGYLFMALLAWISFG